MKSILTILLGRLPIGWMQLLHNRTRLIAAVGGVTFANVLIFMQLGFMSALFETSVLTHRKFHADVVLTCSDFHTLREANPIPRSRMYQALCIEGVVDAVPTYLGTMNWTDPDSGDTTNFRVIGVDPDSETFTDQELQSQISKLKEPDTAVIDRRMRDFPKIIGRTLEENRQFELEASGRRMHVVGMFQQGASFDVDGCIIVSADTFLRLFPRRRAGTPSLILLRCASGADPEKIANALNRHPPLSDTQAFTKNQLTATEQGYQAKQSPIGFVFGFGVAMGLVVGLVIVYQVLSTDVQDHLSEYATFKAIGYSPRYFLNIILEEALALSAWGFVPGFLISSALYRLAANATALPISMTWTRPILVFGLTATMCALSGLIATQRLRSADPADLF